MTRIEAAIVWLLLAAPCAHAVDRPVAPRSGDDVPGTHAPASPQAQALAQSGVDDDAITRRAVQAIRADPRLAGTDVSVNTSDGVVSLTGSVGSREQSVIAAEHAQMPDGVMRVDNHITVTPP